MGFRPAPSGLTFPPGKNPADRRRPFEELADSPRLPGGNAKSRSGHRGRTPRTRFNICQQSPSESRHCFPSSQPPKGKVEGATFRDTRHESSFRPFLGNKISAWFSIGDLANAQTIVAVESPIEALSYHTLFAGRNDPLAIVSCSGSFVPEDLLFQAYDRRQSFVVALNNDEAGGLGWQKAWDSTTEWTGFKISSACPQCNDWNSDLVASRRITNGQRNGFHLQSSPSYSLWISPQPIPPKTTNCVFTPALASTT